MRLGLLKAAQTSFNQAKKFQGGGLAVGGSLGDNLAALDEHLIFAESIGHNPHAMYKEFSEPQDGFLDSSSDDFYDNDDDYGGGVDDDDYDESGADAYDVPDNEQIDDATNRAIQIAESGDVVGSLPLFEASTRQDPRNSQLWQNLGVTQVSHTCISFLLFCSSTLHSIPFFLSVPLSNSFR